MKIKIYFLDGQTAEFIKRYKSLNVGRVFDILDECGEHNCNDFIVIDFGENGQAKILAIEYKFLMSVAKVDKFGYILFRPGEMYNLAFDIARKHFGKDLIKDEFYYKGLYTK